MKAIKVYRLKDKKVFADRCYVASTAWTRFMGLMGKSGLERGTGLLIQPCNSIHTFFMKFPIDVVYLDDRKMVKTIRRGMKPWRMDFPVWGARSVLELPEGGSAEMSEGDILCLS